MEMSGEIRRIKSWCYGCQCSDAGIIGINKDGELIGIEGDPEAPHNYGRTCAKCLSSIMAPYNPLRVMKPLRRTNKRGFGVDPKWEEISWDEALNIIAEKLRWIREEYNPRAHLVCWFDYPSWWFVAPWLVASGGQFFFGGSIWCGWYHNVYYNFYQSFMREVDYEHIKYLILWGSQSGTVLDALATLATKEQADARRRGMKLVVIDPVATNAVKNADEWIPIRPGTDGALALGMLNLLLNEYKIYDEEFIKHYTNGPYLILPDGHYARDPKTNKPLIWDRSRERAVPFYEAKDPALEGVYEVNGVKCIPAFQLLREHVKKWDLEKVSEITTVPAKTIRRVTKEFGEAASIGSTITIEGKQFPYRPAAVMQGKGPGPHRHAMHTVYLIELLNVIIGNSNVPGGSLGIAPYYRRKWKPSVNEDGLLVSANSYWKFGCFDPLLNRGKAVRPYRYNCRELLPIASYADTMVPIVMANKELFSIDYDIKMTIINHTNIVHNYGNPEEMIKLFDKMNDLIVGFAVELNETMEYLCDIVLPIAHWTERYDPLAREFVGKFQPPGHKDWVWAFRRPIKKPPTPYHLHPCDLLIEIARRAGFERDLIKAFNEYWQIDEKYRLDPDKHYTYLDFGDALLKDRHGIGVEWFERTGNNFYIEKRTPEEAYPWPGIFGGRIPIYFEWWIDVGEEVKKVVKELGIEDVWDVDDYTPLLDWKGCEAHYKKKPDQFWLINPRLNTHHQAMDLNNPWLREVDEQLVKSYGVLINAKVANALGIKKGDIVIIEGEGGVTEEGTAIPTEGIHPECIAIFAAAGKTARGEKIARGSGLHWNKFVIGFSCPRREDIRTKLDKVSGAIDACVLIRIKKK
jgi:anaerobic selenocysteine-containing dehydrogenase